MKLKLTRQELQYIPPKHTNPENGFVLLEALLSVVLLSIGIMALIQIYQKSLQISQFRKHYLEPAQEIAESVMAELELKAVTNLREVRAVPPKEDGLFDYQVINSDWQAATDLQEVKVKVSWTDRGKPGSIILTTLLPVAKINLDNVE